MGFQDRDYNREPYDDYGYRRRRGGGGMSVTMRLVLLNTAIWLVNGLLFAQESNNPNLLAELLALHVNTIWHPAYWWKFLTYGFVHSPGTIWHLAGNMITLIMFGYGMMLGIGPNGFGLVRGENVEERLGRLEFLIFYLLTIIVGGVVFCIVNMGERGGAIGASGGCVGVVILYALLYPRKTLLLYGILPIPMWALGMFIVFMDASGAAGYTTQGVAYSIHLAGAAFALVYYFVFLSNGYRIVDIFFLPAKLFRRLFTSRAKVKIYRGDKPTKKSDKKEEEFERRLDEILGRYGQVGEAGLTPDERAFLKEASRKYRNR